jgi:hypothetical protein
MRTDVMWIRLVLVLAPLALICAAVLAVLYRRADAVAKAALEIEAGKTINRTLLLPTRGIATALAGAFRS